MGRRDGSYLVILPFHSALIQILPANALFVHPRQVLPLGHPT